MPPELGAAALSARRRNTWLLPLLCLLTVGGSLAWAWSLHDEMRSWPGEPLTQAEAWEDAGRAHAVPPPEGRGWQAVSLPDSWDVTRPGFSGDVWYRLRIDPGKFGDAALLVPKLSRSGEIYLNGVRLYSGGIGEPLPRRWNTPLLIHLPRDLLRPQGNVLTVRVAGISRFWSGLSALQLGPRAELRKVHAWREFWQQDGAFLTITFTAAAGLLVLFAWFYAQRDPLFAYFGLAALVWSARNSNFIVVHPPMDVDVWALLMHGGHAWFIALFGLFVMQYTGSRSRLLRVLLWAFALGNSFLIVVGGLVNVQAVLRASIAPGTALAAVLAWLLLAKAWRDRSFEAALLASTYVTFFVLTLRDALVLTNKLPFGSYYISHYTGLLLFLSIAWVLIRRYALSLRTLESWSNDLEHKLAEREAQLRALFAREKAVQEEGAALAERRRIMSDLHDGLGMQLVSTLNASRRDGVGREAMTEAIQACLDDLRLAIDAMEPVERDLIALLGNFRYRMEKRLRAAGLNIEWAVQPIPELSHMQPSQMLQLLRVVQEGVTNVLKHANATRVRFETGVETEGGRTHVMLRISDNGRGFDPDRAGRGMGLRNLAARAAAIGCKLTMASDASGTRLSLAIPLPAQGA